PAARSTGRAGQGHTLPVNQEREQCSSAVRAATRPNRFARPWNSTNRSSPSTCVPRIQEAHATIYHTLIELTRTMLDERGLPNNAERAKTFA
ncbi:MAG: hypothetical protein LC737_09765, partial [Chloroflexi bacterium]|nr:hypothetical protein [Chloroflexota bacterium]